MDRSIDGVREALTLVHEVLSTFARDRGLAEPGDPRGEFHVTWRKWVSSHGESLPKVLGRIDGT